MLVEQVLFWVQPAEAEVAEAEGHWNDCAVLMRQIQKNAAQVNPRSTTAIDWGVPLIWGFWYLQHLIRQVSESSDIKILRVLIASCRQNTGPADARQTGKDDATYTTPTSSKTLVTSL